MVRCPRADRVAVPSAMIHLLSCGTVDHGRLVWSRQLGADRPPKSVSVRKPEVRPGESEHLHLRELMDAVDSPRGLAMPARLGPETVRDAGQLDRQIRRF